MGTIFLLEYISTWPPSANLAYICTTLSSNASFMDFVVNPCKS